MRFPRTRETFLAVLVSAALAAWPTIAPAAPTTSRPATPAVIADFETAVPDGTQSGNVEVKIVVDTGAAASGAGCLQIRLLKGSEDAYVIFPLPAHTNVDPGSKLVAWMRRTDAGKPIRMHWFALDGDNWVIFQRLFQFDPGAAEWVRVEWPLWQWRWGNERTGEWTDVRAIALRVESETSEIWLDDIGLTGVANTDGFREEFLKKAAFAGRKSRFVIEDGFLAATDAVEDVSLADLKDMIARMKQVRAWTKRVFGEAVRPTCDGPPTALLVFQKREDYVAFFKRLGQEWHVEIVPPRSGGYTVQDISACVYEPARGRKQPVAFHESVHSVLSRELRLLAGTPGHGWLHEGVANYLQLCLYPESLRAGEYADNFSHPIGAKTFFRPLEEVLSKPVPRHYAQLASLTAFLVEEKPDWLKQIARGLADGKNLGDILKGLGTDVAGLEKLWFEWGQRTYGPLVSQPDRPHRHFPPPQEWAPEPHPAAV